MDPTECTIRIETIRNPRIRHQNGDLSVLAASITQEGLRRPVTLWQDGTLISGSRRLAAHFLLRRDTIPAVFVSTIEDAAKRLLDDVPDTYKAQPMVWSEICALWDLLRRLDAPAAAARADAARRRGVELRRATQAGKRKAGRSHGRSEDYVLLMLCQPFNTSSATARRVEVVYQTATGRTVASAEKMTLAKQIMRDLDAGASVWNGYQRLLDYDRAPRPVVATAPRAPVVPLPSAPAARQRQAWEKALPQLEGLTAGLIELGPANNELTWAEIGPVCTRLAAVRRELEKMIRQMREHNQS